MTCVCPMSPISDRMSELAAVLEASSLSNADLMSLLETLDKKEASLSEQRRLLHERIDQLQVQNGDTPEVAALRQEERSLSTSRLHLHQRITELRLERGRRVADLRADLHALD